MSRTHLQFGDEPLTKLQNAHVLVAGLGGVGGICAEMVARSGIGTMTIIDMDTVDISNINRQIPALHSTAGMTKASIMQQRLLDINPSLQLNVLSTYLTQENTEAILATAAPNFAIDCIDTLGSKVFLIQQCLQQNIPMVSSMGAGAKTDPSKVIITDISKTYECNLARYVRKRLHAIGITKGVPVVFSPEYVDQSKIMVTQKAFPKKSIVGTVSYMPAIFGCMAASVAIRSITGEI